MPIAWVTGGTLEACEMHGSVEESVDVSNFAQSVQLRCPWDDRYGVRDELLFGPSGVEGPLAWPYHSNPTSFVQAVSIMPAGGVSTADGDGLTYEEALLNVGFAVGEKKEQGETGTFDFFSEEFNPNAEFLTIDHSNFRWTNASTGDVLQPAEAPGLLIVGADYTQTWYNLSSIHTDFLSLIGSVNSGAHAASLLGLTFAAETLLYTPPTTSRTIKGDGTGLWNLSTTFRFRASTWNKFWRTKTQDFEAMYIDGGSAYKNYPTGSFANILV